MKKLFLLIFPALFLFSCKKDDRLPRVETITKGSKWGIEIGSSPMDVYSRLQALGKEKNFDQVAVVYRTSYSKPQDVQHLLAFYNALTLENNTAVIDRAIIWFPNDKVYDITAGGALPEAIAKWPEDVPEETAIHKNDPVDSLYNKLLAIYQVPAYSQYKITLPDKPLNKPFDPDMSNYEEWAFSMSVRVNASIMGTSSVRLYFKNGQLDKIRHEYSESTVYNDPAH